MHCYRFFNGLKPTFKSHNVRLALCNRNSTSSKHQHSFRPKTAVVVSKVTRYQFEKHLHQDYSEEQLKNCVCQEKYASIMKLNCRSSIEFQFCPMMAMQGQGCGIAMPDSYIEPAGQVDFPIQLVRGQVKINK